MQDVFAIYGTGGYAREVLPLLRQQLDAQGYQEQPYLIDDYLPKGSKVNGATVFSFVDFNEQFSDHRRYCCIAIADPVVRSKLDKACHSANMLSFSIIAQNAIKMDDVTLGSGSIINPFVTMTSNIQIGRCFHANLYSYVAHDCIIGDYVTFAPAVRCNGNITIGDNVYIGTNAIIYPGTNDSSLVIGENSKIGAGSVVKKSVPPNTIVSGNPAKIIKRLT